MDIKEKVKNIGHQVMASPLWVVSRRELENYFETPVAYVFIVVFLLLTGIFSFYVGGFYERQEADLEPFFVWHPWLYLFFIPAVSMRLWSEEKKSGTLELLMTLPLATWQAVLGKFLAAWLFTGIALLLTAPMWIIVNYLGNPDNGVIMTAYIGSFLMAGGYLAIGSCMSALTRNQVIALVLGLTVCFIFTLSGFPLVLDFFSGWLPQGIIDIISTFSFITHFNEIASGIISVNNLIYFISLISLWLFINILILNEKRG